jgi:hypothetical protein
MKRIPVAIKPRDMTYLVQMLDSVVTYCRQNMEHFPRAADAPPADAERLRDCMRAWHRYERKARALSSQFSGIYLADQNGMLPPGPVNLDR